jgi:hypothetical protein
MERDEKGHGRTLAQVNRVTGGGEGKANFID